MGWGRRVFDRLISLLDQHQPYRHFPMKESRLLSPQFPQSSHAVLSKNIRTQPTLG